ncbi:uridine kinase [Candidatus Neomarinimicrobiota bacterium]
MSTTNMKLPGPANMITSNPLNDLTETDRAVHPSATHASLGFLLAAAIEEEIPGQAFFIEYSFIGGYYCHLGAMCPSTADFLERITERVVAYVHGNDRLEFLHVDRSVLQRRFQEQGRDDKLEILIRLNRDPVPAARFRNYMDYRFEPMTEDMRLLRNFSLDPYDQGFVLRFPSMLPPYEMAPMHDSPKLFHIIQQRSEWGRALGVMNLRQLNRIVDTNQFRELILVAEGLHEKNIARIADKICAQPDRRVIFVSGPSSSGKTTFSKRLPIQLKVNGYATLSLSMDDYFVDKRDMTPQADGTLDFEDITALNVNLLSSHVQTLLQGKSVSNRLYSFKKGKGSFSEEQVSLPKEAFLIIEGLHGLNPVFMDALGRNTIQRIYISAITQLNVDNEHRISSSDNRLIRRLVRDAQFRNYHAEETLQIWPSVRRGEEKHIFAYQEDADFMFNSALIYELSALRPKAEEVLATVPTTSEAYEEAIRLLTFLSFIAPVNLKSIPRTSIIREFLGGSLFHY